MPYGLSRRAEIVVLFHQGWILRAIGQLVGMTRRHDAKWITRFHRGGIWALAGRDSERRILRELGVYPGRE